MAAHHDVGLVPLEHEIAVVLDLTPNAVSVALSRSKRKLVALLGTGRQDRHDAGHLQGVGTAETEGDER